MNRSFILFLVSCFFSYSTGAQPYNLHWAKQYRGGGSEQVAGFVADSAGHTYMTGTFTEGLIFGSNTLFSIGNRPTIFVAKFDASGNVLWAKSYGNTNSNIASGIALDALGNLFISGSFSGSAYFGTGNNNLSGAFVARLSSVGDTLWVRRATGPELAGQKMKIDASNNIVFSGIFREKMVFGNDSLINPTALADNLFLSKLDNNGNLLWLKKMDGTLHTPATWDANAMVNDVATDLQGNIYTTGYYRDSLNFDGLLLSNGDSYLAKFNSNGVLHWVKDIVAVTPASLSLSQRVGGQSLAVDGSGNIWMSGTMYDSVSIAGTSLPGIGLGQFLAKFDTSGNVTLARKTSSLDIYFHFSDLTTDKSGGVYMSGLYGGSMQFGTTTYTTGVQTCSPYIAKVQPNGSFSWGEGLRSSYVAGILIASGGVNDIYMGGSFNDSLKFQNYSFYSGWRMYSDIMTAKLSYSVPSAVVGKSADNKLIVYPQPGNDWIRFKFPAAVFSTINIYDQLGRVVIQHPIETNTNALELNVSHLPSGIYSVRAVGAAEHTAQKIVVQH